MTYDQLRELMNVDLVDYKEAPGMRLILRFRIHRETNEQSYLDLINIKEVQQ